MLQNSNVQQEPLTQYSESPIHKEPNSPKDKVPKSKDLSSDNISQSNKNKVQKFMSEVSTNSSSQL
ncbi:4185_t:CDS:2 [Diversispora eburnea]|uniref:4185_t:CDS:1 n=1 Tax=Diversispora eburnea TaxID=1213867 RepID=A0A9N9B5D8_9GLOM|nr:4185_t:CDS:2 [Diversispora eburnea]